MLKLRINFFGVLILVSYLMLTPLNAPNVGVDNADKIVHAACYGYLFVSGYAVFRRAFPLWIFLLGHGALVELIQGYIPFRSASAGDLAADGAGVLLGYIMIRSFAFIRRTA